MKCKKCDNSRESNFEFQDEIICNKCGSVYVLEYIGCYPHDDGGQHFYDASHEPKEWKEKYLSVNKENRE